MAHLKKSSTAKGDIFTINYDRHLFAIYIVHLLNVELFQVRSEKEPIWVRVSVEVLAPLMASGLMGTSLQCA